MTTDLKRVGLIGGGVIGAGWAARFLLNGIDVAVYDPDPDLARKVQAVLGNARRAWTSLIPEKPKQEGRLIIAGSIAEAVTGADFVQESLPERLDLKQCILAEADALLPPEVVIGSSTSGLLPSEMQQGMRHPERLVVGHPFNPVYLLPLVEVCGGAKTSDAAKAAATEIYTAIGMRPLQVRKEIDGFIADRLLEALWREALWLVNDGVASTEEIDDAIRYGAGLRWSFMGTFLIYRLAGGEDGMRHFLAQFGPALKLPWTKLVAPELTDELVDKVSDFSDQQAAGVDLRTLEALRDDCLVSVMQGLASHDYGAGKVVSDFRAALAARAPEPAGELLHLHQGTVPAEWIDYNGHMTEFRYAQVLSDATDAVLARIGADAAYVASGRSYYTVETHTRLLAEMKEGEGFAVSTQVLSFDGKRLRLFHTVTRRSDGAEVATGEQMLLHVDAAQAKAAPADAAVLDKLGAVTALHGDLPHPEAAGRAVGQKR